MPPECVVGTDCPGFDTECRKRACNGGKCADALVDAGTPLVQQTAGDCKTAVCSGSGGVMQVYTAGDPPSLGTPDCGQTVCTEQGPVLAPWPDGKACASTCFSPPCSVFGAHGLCEAGTCVNDIPVVCNVNGTIYRGCDGVAHPGLFITWDNGDSKCAAGGPGAFAYCAPGTLCNITQDGVPLSGVGVCQ